MDPFADKVSGPCLMLFVFKVTDILTCSVSLVTHQQRHSGRSMLASMQDAFRDQITSRSHNNHRSPPCAIVASLLPQIDDKISVSYNLRVDISYVSHWSIGHMGSVDIDSMTSWEWGLLRPPKKNFAALPPFGFPQHAVYSPDVAFILLPAKNLRQVRGSLTMTISVRDWIITNSSGNCGVVFGGGGVKR